MQEKNKAFFHLKWAIEDSAPAPTFGFVVTAFHAKSLHFLDHCYIWATLHQLVPKAEFQLPES